MCSALQKCNQRQRVFGKICLYGKKFCMKQKRIAVEQIVVVLKEARY